MLSSKTHPKFVELPSGTYHRHPRVASYARQLIFSDLECSVDLHWVLARTGDAQKARQTANGNVKNRAQIAFYSSSHPGLLVLPGRAYRMGLGAL